MDSQTAEVSTAIGCGAGAEREALDTLRRLDSGLDPLVREHALAIVSALFSEPGRSRDESEGGVALAASVDERKLRVELGDACLDRSPGRFSPGPGLSASLVELVERLADRWEISYDRDHRELRLSFEIAR